VAATRALIRKGNALPKLVQTAPAMILANKAAILSPEVKNPMAVAVSVLPDKLVIQALITPSVKKKFKFIEGNSVQRQLVGVTCETCSVKDCLERASPPIHLNQKVRNEKTDATVQEYMAKYS